MKYIKIMVLILIGFIAGVIGRELVPLRVSVDYKQGYRDGFEGGYFHGWYTARPYDFYSGKKPDINYKMLKD